MCICCQLLSLGADKHQLSPSVTHPLLFGLTRVWKVGDGHQTQQMLIFMLHVQGIPGDAYSSTGPLYCVNWWLVILLLILLVGLLNAPDMESIHVIHVCRRM